MPMADWIHHYPHVHALLQQEGEILEGVSTEGEEPGDVVALSVAASDYAPLPEATGELQGGMDAPWPPQPVRWESLETFARGVVRRVQWWRDGVLATEFRLLVAPDVHRVLCWSLRAACGLRGPVLGSWYGIPLEVVAWMPPQHWAVHWRTDVPSFTAAAARGRGFLHQTVLRDRAYRCRTERPLFEESTSICHCGGVVITWQCPLVA